MSKKQYTAEMLTGSTSDTTEKYLDIIKNLPDRELTKVVMQKVENLRDACKAELQIRQTKAIEKFNINSTILSLTMIVLAGIHLYLMFKELINEWFGKIF